MEVIAHHYKSMQFPASIVTGFEQGSFKRLSRSFALEYSTAVISAVDDVIEGSGILKAQLAGHAPKRSNEMGNSQESRNDPLTPASGTTDTSVTNKPDTSVTLQVFLLELDLSRDFRFGGPM